MFLTLFTWIAALPVFMVLNRIRGGGMHDVTDRIPGRALYYVSLTMGGLTAAILDWRLGVVVSIGTLVCFAPGWGVRFDLHRHDKLQVDDPRQNDVFVKSLDLISFGSEHVWMFWRLSLFSAPMLALWVFWAGAPVWSLYAAGAFGALGVGAYELRWRTTWGNRLTELIVGALWWAVVLLMALSVRIDLRPPGDFSGISL